MYKHPLLNRDKMSPQEALDILIEGNHRFTNSLTANKDLMRLVKMCIRDSLWARQVATSRTSYKKSKTDGGRFE